MSQSLRVLLVEDSEDDALLLARELRRGDYELRIERVETGEHMRAAIHRETWDVIFADFSLPHFSAPEALTIAKELIPNTPFLVISGTVGETVAVDAHARRARMTSFSKANGHVCSRHWHGNCARPRNVAAANEPNPIISMLFNEMLDGFAVHEIVTDEQDHPVDYRFLAVNPAFEQHDRVARRRRGWPHGAGSAAGAGAILDRAIRPRGVDRRADPL